MYRIATERKKDAESIPQAGSNREDHGVCSQKRGSYWNEDPTTMYFKRWGSLAPPPERQLLPFVSPKYSTITGGVQYRRSGVLACKKLSLDSTRQDNTEWILLRVILILLFLWDMF